MTKTLRMRQEIGRLSLGTALLTAGAGAATASEAAGVTRQADLGGMALGAALIAAGLGARWLMRRFTE